MNTRKRRGDRGDRRGADNPQHGGTGANRIEFDPATLRVGNAVRRTPSEDHWDVFIVSRIDPDGTVFVRQMFFYYDGPEMRLVDVEGRLYLPDHY